MTNDAPLIAITHSTCISLSTYFSPMRRNSSVQVMGETVSGSGTGREGEFSGRVRVERGNWGMKKGWVIKGEGVVLEGMGECSGRVREVDGNGE